MQPIGKVFTSAGTFDEPKRAREPFKSVSSDGTYLERGKVSYRNAPKASVNSIKTDLT